MSRKKKKQTKSKSPGENRQKPPETDDEDFDDVFFEEQEEFSATLDPAVVSDWMMNYQKVLDQLRAEKDPYVVLHYLDQLEATMDLIEAFLDEELPIDEFKDVFSPKFIEWMLAMDEATMNRLLSSLDAVMSEFAERGEQMIRKPVDSFLKDHESHLPLALAIMAYFTYDFDEILEHDGSFPESQRIVELYQTLLDSPTIPSLIKQFCEEELEQLEIILGSLPTGETPRDPS